MRWMHGGCDGCASATSLDFHGKEFRSVEIQASVALLLRRVFLSLYFAHLNLKRC
jgi:hypothetical protein